MFDRNKNVLDLTSSLEVFVIHILIAALFLFGGCSHASSKHQSGQIVSQQDRLDKEVTDLKWNNTATAWTKHLSVGLVFVPGRGSGTGILFADNVVLTSGYLSPRVKGIPEEEGTLPLGSYFILYAGSKTKEYRFKATRYLRLDRTGETGGALSAFLLSEKITRRVQGITPVRIAKLTPNVGEELLRVGFSGFGCAAQFGGQTKLEARWVLVPPAWTFVRPTGTVCPRDPGALMLFAHNQEAIGISNYDPSSSTDVFADLISVAPTLYQYVESNWRSK